LQQRITHKERFVPNLGVRQSLIDWLARSAMLPDPPWSLAKKLCHLLNSHQVIHDFILQNKKGDDGNQSAIKLRWNAPSPSPSEFGKTT
jgi:hypothetical protein